jgi:hypothetical protein
VHFRNTFCAVRRSLPMQKNIIRMFFMVFSMLAHYLHPTTQSLNNNNWPNNKNDVITDLGGEGDFPMFRYEATQSIYSPQDSETPPLQLPYRPNGNA